VRSETSLFIVFADHVIQRIRRRRFIEEDCDGAVTFRLGSGLALATAAISDAVRTTTPMGFPAWANRRASTSAFTSFADALLSKTISPVGDVSLNAGVPSIAAHCLELSHRELAGSPDVYRAHRLPDRNRRRIKPIDKKNQESAGAERHGASNSHSLHQLTAGPTR
jgi:hypothetical protein